MSDASSTHIADARKENWVERYLPGYALPYAQLMRLDRPMPVALLLLPCWWGLALAQLAAGGGLPNLWHGFLFLSGAIVMRGAGCVVNDIADRKFDAQVARTKNRPLASGRVSVMQALVLLAGLCALGLAVLLQFNVYTVITGATSLLIVAIYPFMKRITHWPQAVLGLAFNWGALLGWTATHAALSLAPILLYGAGIAWTLAYDTIYAHQDKEDDVLIGVKSTALLFGASTRWWLALFFTLAGSLVAGALLQAGAGLWSWAGLAVAALHAAWQTRSFDHADATRCLKLFRANRTLGLLLLAGLFMDTVTR